MTYYRRKRGRMAFFLIYLILSLYLVNIAIGFIKIPEFMEKAEPWILLISGILLFFGGFNFLKVKRHRL